MVLYQIPSLAPELTVAVGWDAALASFVARVDHAGRDGADGRPALWFGAHQGEIPTVCELQRAIGRYAVIRADVHAALEADQAAGDGRPPAGGTAGRTPRWLDRLPAGALPLAVAVAVVAIVVVWAALGRW
jgi:hypothetical protein